MCGHGAHLLPVELKRTINQDGVPSSTPRGARSVLGCVWGGLRCTFLDTSVSTRRAATTALGPWQGLPSAADVVVPTTKAMPPNSTVLPGSSGHRLTSRPRGRSRSPLHVVAPLVLLWNLWWLFTLVTAFDCGDSAGGAVCKGTCCSKYGYCGSTDAYCATDCQPAFGCVAV
jgi:hypothetical protein